LASPDRIDGPPVHPIILKNRPPILQQFTDMSLTDLDTLVPARPAYTLTAAEFRGLAEVPPELEWFANITNPRTRRAYQQDVRDFTAFVGITRPEEFRTVTRAHLIAWRKDLEARNLAPSSIRRKLAALASLFDDLCERNAVPHNPADGVKRPRANHAEGLTPIGASLRVNLLNNNRYLLITGCPCSIELSAGSWS
jgi:hypothetical protein